jgi:hypothetical protein
MIRQIACLCVLVTVAGCGGASVSRTALHPPALVPTAPNGAQKTVNGYPVFDPATLRAPADAAHATKTALRPASGPEVDILRNELRRLHAGGRKPMASFGGSINDGHGQDGFFISASLDANHGAMEFVHTVWVPGTDVTLNQPPASNYNGYFLYAPTTHPPSSCIEVGTAYHTSPPPYPTGTNAYVYFFDFCNNSGGATYNDDSTFRGTYNFWDSNINAPSIDVLVTTGGSNLSAPDWYAYVWNTRTYSWDLLYSRTYATRQAGLSPPTDGWSIFEPNFQSQPTAQPCKEVHTPQFAADYIRFENPSNGTTTYIDSSNSSRTTLGACVTADSTGPASYNFSLDQANWRWEEYANGN